MFSNVQHRLALAYAATFAVALLLLGPVLYFSFSQQMTTASDVALRLAAHRQAALALVTRGTTLGIRPSFRAPPALDQRDTFYVLLTPTGRVQADTDLGPHTGLPDLAAVRQAVRQKAGVFSTVATGDAGDVRLFTVPILHGGRVVALLQAGQSRAPLASAQRSLLVFLLELGAATVVAATVGGLLVTRQAMRPIRSAFAAQRAFVADASHELRTPLTLMRTNAEVLLEAEVVTDPEDRTLVEDIVNQAAHMGRLITDLLTLARLDAGALMLERAPMALDTLVTTTVRQMRHLATRHGVCVTCRTVPSLVVRGDAGRLEQVILILLDNAIKYNRVGGTVELVLCRDGRQAVLEVCDTGPGIAADELPHLFARFRRGRDAGRRSEGSGLGLAIAAGIVQAHHGRISVQSTPGEGSTFRVVLPLVNNT